MNKMMKSLRMIALAGLALTAAACSNPYDPTQRAIGGGLIGAGGGAAIGGLAGGGSGAALGAVVGGLGGAAVGAATTPTAPTYGYDDRRRGRGRGPY
jgi:hypothetical protein